MPLPVPYGFLRLLYSGQPPLALGFRALVWYLLDLLCGVGGLEVGLPLEEMLLGAYVPVER